MPGHGPDDVRSNIDSEGQPISVAAFGLKVEIVVSVTAHNATIPCEALVQSLLWTGAFSACRFSGRPNTQPSDAATGR